MLRRLLQKFDRDNPDRLRKHLERKFPGVHFMQPQFDENGEFDVLFWEHDAPTDEIKRAVEDYFDSDIEWS